MASRSTRGRKRSAKWPPSRRCAALPNYALQLTRPAVDPSGLPSSSQLNAVVLARPVILGEKKLKVFADYHQFYIWDAGLDPRAPEDYSDEDVRRMVKVVPNVVVINPVRNMEVPVELAVLDQDPGYDPDDWDHVVEAALTLPTGKLQVHECTGGAVLDAEVKPGAYRVRALFSGLDTLFDDGLDGRDLYRVVLWPGDPCEIRVVKQWQGSPRAG